MDEEAAILAEIKQLGETEVRQRLATNQFTLAYYEPALRGLKSLIEPPPKNQSAAETPPKPRKQKSLALLRMLLGPQRAQLNARQ